MVLATHVVVGASLAQLVSNNLPVAFALGFVSHFLLDAIPHWDYPLASSKTREKDLNNDLVIGRQFVFDLGKISLDLLIGVFLTGLLLAPDGHSNWLLYLIGAAGAVLPDFLQFAYFKLRWFWPLRVLQRFHLWIHADYRLDGRPVIGMVSQMMLILVVNWFIILLTR